MSNDNDGPSGVGCLAWIVLIWMIFGNGFAVTNRLIDRVANTDQELRKINALTTENTILKNRVSELENIKR